jgi:hypothetical protein
MKKSKILIFAALAAAATISVGCSNDDVVTTKDSGVPLKVTAGVNDGTRAQQITSLNYFQLYGFLGDTNNEFKNKTFAGTNGQADWTATDANFASNWPAAKTDYTFYGVSENSSSGMSTAFTNATFTTSAQTFTYTLPDNIADQKDLLVAKASGNSSSGLTMNFTHALATTTLNISIDPSITNFAEYPGYRLRAAIKTIELHNVYTGGTYDFSNGTWSNLTKGTYVIDLSSNPLIIDTPNDAVLTKAVPLGENEKIMFIPGEVSDYWNIKANAGSDVSTVPKEGTGSAYVTFEVQALGYDGGCVVRELDELTTKVKETVSEDQISFDTKTDDGTEDENGYYIHNRKIATLDGGIFYVSKGENNADEEDNGYFDHTGKKIATLAGEVLDVSHEIFGQDYADNNIISEQIPVMFVTYDETYHPSDFLTECENAGYGIAYKPFSAAVAVKNGENIMTTLSPLTLQANKTFNLKINIAGAVQKASPDGDGIFGSPADAGN